MANDDLCNFVCNFNGRFVVFDATQYGAEDCALDLGLCCYLFAFLDGDNALIFIYENKQKKQGKKRPQRSVARHIACVWNKI